MVNLKLFRIIADAVTGEISLQTSESGGQEQQHSGDFGPKKLLFVLGCLVSLGGVIFVFNILDKVYSGSRFNVDVAVGGFIIGAILFWLGCGMIVFSFGLL